MSIHRTAWSLPETAAIFEKPGTTINAVVDRGIVLPATSYRGQGESRAARHLDRRGLLQVAVYTTLAGKLDGQVVHAVLNALPDDLVKTFEKLDLEDAPVPDDALMVVTEGVLVFIPALLRTLVERIQRARLIV